MGISNPTLMKLNRFIFFTESSSSPQLQSPSPSPNPSPDEIIPFILISILDRLKEWVAASTTTTNLANGFASALEASWVRKAATISTLILVGALLILSLFFFTVPTLLFLKFAAISLGFICALALILLWFTCRALFIALVFTCRLLFAAATAMCRCLLSSQTSLFFAEATSTFRAGYARMSWRRPSIHPENRFFSGSPSPEVDPENRHQHPGYGCSSAAWNKFKAKSNPYERPENHFSPQPPGFRQQYPEPQPTRRNRSDQGAGVRQPEKQGSSTGAKGKEKCNSDDQRSSSKVFTDRQKMKESYEYTRAMKAEWAARQRELRRQAEEARRQRSSKRAENKRTEANERRQKQKQQKPETSRRKDDNEKSSVERERIREDIRKKLSQVEKSCGNMASLLDALGIPLDLNPSQKQIRAAYKEACGKFHPDRLRTTDLRHQVEAEEKFKLISAMKHNL